MAAYGSSVPPPYGSVVGTAPSNFENPVQKVELKISCRNILDMDFFSKSDPFVVMYMKYSDTWREYGRTEIIMDNLNPDFVKSFIVDYFFEEQQMIKFEVYDSDADTTDLSCHDLIGKFVTSLGSIVGENNGKVEQPLQTPSAKDTERNTAYAKKSLGTIIIRCEEVSTCKSLITLQLSGRKLDKKDFFGKSDPYLEFKRCNEDNSYTVVHRTEVIKNTLDPNWKTFTLPVRDLCNGDLDRNIQVVCNDWNSNGDVDLIGQFDITVNDLKNGNDRTYELINPEKKAKKKKYRNSGMIYIQESKYEERGSFLEYLSGGTELNFLVAIDFTASNGNPSDRSSLHYSSPQVPSQYIQTLQAVGAILEDYDSDKLFPAFGFGAKLPPSGNVFHDFALNFNPLNPNCHGVNEIIAAYYNAIATATLYGPTNFSPVIHKCIKIASDSYISGVEGSQYFVLMIITDGIITDMEKTKQAIVDAADLPISIIIIGVGNADFESMEELDGDDVRVSYQGRSAKRDIVQFVPFRDYMTGNMYDPASSFKLAKDVLHELPDQLVEFMSNNGIKPNPPPPYSY